MARNKKTDEEHKKEIIEAATPLFIKYGYNKTTMEDIAKAVRKGKSTLYYYYKSKDDIIEEVVREAAHSMTGIFKTKLVAVESAKDRLLEYYSVEASEVKKMADIYSLLLQEINENFFLQKRLRYIYSQQDILQIKEILQYGMDRKEFEFVTDENIDNLSRTISILNRNMIISFLIEENMEKWDESFLLLGEVLTKGLLATK
jgi:AcrR family transcriptional regulator